MTQRCCVLIVGMNLWPFGGLLPSCPRVALPRRRLRFGRAIATEHIYSPHHRIFTFPPSFNSIYRTTLKAVEHVIKPFLHRFRCGLRARCPRSCCSAGWARGRRRRLGISWTTAAACWDASNAARISGSASRARMMVPGFCQTADAVSQSIGDWRWPSRIIIVSINAGITHHMASGYGAASRCPR